MQSANLFLIFLSGLTTGGLTCLALQGGLLASVIAQKESQSPQKTLFPVVSFLTGKLLIHTLLGFMLGFLGQSFSLSPITRGWIQIILGLYLLGIAGNLLDLHPIFRYFVITPPKFLSKLAKNESKNKSFFAPFLLGLTTVFIPCAVTQATEIIAIGSGSPIYGALIMFFFILGTAPTFLIFGFLLNSGAKSFQRYFPKIAATLLFILSIYTVNNGVGLTGSIYTLQNFYLAATTPANNVPTGGTPALRDGYQTTSISVTNSGYTPQVINLKRGIPVRLTLKTQSVRSCSRAFTIPALNIQKLLPETGETIIEFTPTELGPLAFSCSMGMYTGRFNITN